MGENATTSNEYIRLWRPPDVEAVELYAARLRCHSFGKHFHEDFTIGINDAGAGASGAVAQTTSQNRIPSTC